MKWRGSSVVAELEPEKLEELRRLVEATFAAMHL